MPSLRPLTARERSHRATSTRIVTLVVPAVYGARNVAVVGDFTAWVPIDMPFDGTRFAVTLVLPRHGRWHYRFRLDESSWINDPDADDYEPCLDGGAVSIRGT